MAKYLQGWLDIPRDGYTLHFLPSKTNATKSNLIQIGSMTKVTFLMSCNYCSDTYMFFNIFFSLVSHLCSITNSNICHGALQKFISSKLRVSCLHASHALGAFCTCVLKQGCGASRSCIWCTSMVTCRKENKNILLIICLVKRRSHCDWSAPRQNTTAMAGKSQQTGHELLFHTQVTMITLESLGNDDGDDNHDVRLSLKYKYLRMQKEENRT